MNLARLTAKTRISSPTCDTFSKYLPPFPAHLAFQARSEFMQAVQREIADQLKVQPPFADQAALEAEVARRITFIQDCLVNSGLKTLVLGISGGVDSLTAGLLAQRAMRELRTRTSDDSYKFIAVRLPAQQRSQQAELFLQRLARLDAEPQIEPSVVRDLYQGERS